MRYSSGEALGWLPRHCFPGRNEEEEKEDMLLGHGLQTRGARWCGIPSAG